MSLTLKDLKTILEIALPIIALIAWFVHLEAKVLAHDAELVDIKKQQDTFEKKADVTVDLLQKMAINIEVMKTDISWMKGEIKKP